jgi:pimeloyl-ACP methyl ester carboxylesterase
MSIIQVLLLCILFISLVGLFLLGWARTPQIRDSLLQVAPNSVASLEQVRLGGLNQFILIRGKDKNCPILLFLHGGPGMPAMYLAHRFQRKLENHFVVVHWDRRGAGKSFDENIPIDTMTVQQMIADTCELVQHLRKRFGQEKVYLVGHSWGTYLGMLVIQRHPEFFYAYVGIGQLTGEGHDSQEIAEIQDRFIRQQALETNNQEALGELDSAERFDREKWLFRFGGELRHATSFWPLILAGLQSPEYTLMDVRNVVRGSTFSQRHMKYDAMSGPLIQAATLLQIPVYFFTGRYDYTDPFELTEQYFEKLQAPVKKIVWFEDSAHFPFLEESDKFSDEMVKILSELHGFLQIRNGGNERNVQES